MNYTQRYIGTEADNDNESENIEYKDDQDLMILEDHYSSKEIPLKEKNTGHSQAKVLDRTFVTKGSIISVYKTNDEDRSLQHIINLPPVKTLDGLEISPKKALFHEQDTKMILMDGYDDKKVYYMDIAKGKVVSEFVSIFYSKYYNLLF